MKKFISVLLVLVLGLLVLTGCQKTVEATPSTDDKTEVENPYDMFKFTQYATDGVKNEETAVILFEHANSTFTTYQVAFISCTCRDVSVNMYSVLYIELLNNKDKAEDAAIRTISFADGKGLFGDEDQAAHEFSEEYFDETYLQNLVGKTKADFDAWDGYGKEVEGVDAVTGATVTISNVDSVIKSLFEYHADKYYQGK